MNPTYSNIAHAYRESEYNSIFEFFTVHVDENSQPFLRYEELSARRVDHRYYLDRDHLAVIVNSRSFQMEHWLLVPDSSVSSEIDLSDSETYRYVGLVLERLLAKGRQLLYIRGSEVSLDRLVQL